MAPEFEGPNKELVRSSTRFIRVGDRIIVGKPNDSYTPYIRILLEFQDLFDRFRTSEIYTNPDYFDAGFLNIFNRPIEGGFVGEIKVAANSASLGLPITEEARTKTVELLTQSNPTYRVSSDY